MLSKIKLPPFWIPFIFLFLSSAMGLYLRGVQGLGWQGIPFNNALQAHSHVNFLGWAFMGSIILLHQYFKIEFNKKLEWLWWLLVGSLIGIFFSFSFLGYQALSIIFLSLFLLLSYLYLIQILKGLKNKKSITDQFIKWGIYSYFLSSLAIWAIPITLLNFGKNEYYHDAIYFYLHFLYNGFFTFVIWGVFLKKFLNKISASQEKSVRHFFKLLLLAVMPTYALSLYWHTSVPAVIIIASFGAILQMLSLLYLAKIVKSIRLNGLFSFIIAIYFIKVFLQLLSSFPSLTAIAINYKSFFLIGYLHLFTLGFISLMIIGLRPIRMKLWSIGILLFIAGFILTEWLLFYQGIAMYYNLSGLIQPFYWVFWTTLILFIGIAILTYVSAFRNSNK